jgi:hypothetical protein
MANETLANARHPQGRDMKSLQRWVGLRGLVCTLTCLTIVNPLRPPLCPASRTGEEGGGGELHQDGEARGRSEEGTAQSRASRLERPGAVDWCITTLAHSGLHG